MPEEKQQLPGETPIKRPSPGEPSHMAPALASGLCARLAVLGVNAEGSGDSGNKFYTVHQQSGLGWGRGCEAMGGGGGVCPSG